MAKVWCSISLSKGKFRKDRKYLWFVKFVVNRVLWFVEFAVKKKLFRCSEQFSIFEAFSVKTISTMCQIVWRRTSLIGNHLEYCGGGDCVTVVVIVMANDFRTSKKHRNAGKCRIVIFGQRTVVKQNIFFVPAIGPSLFVFHSLKLKFVVCPRLR